MSNNPIFYKEFLNYPDYPSPLTIKDLKTLNNPRKSLDSQELFENLISQVSKEIERPQQILGRVLSGEKKFDSTELMIALQESQLKLTQTVRIVNDTVRGIKNLEQLQI